MTTRDESNYKSYYKSVYLNSQKKKKRKMKEITILFYLRVMTIPKNNNFDSFFSFTPIKKKKEVILTFRSIYEINLQ